MTGSHFLGRRICQAYRYAVETLNVEPQETLMVAAHAWDLMGAKAQGMQTAFIRRAGAVLIPDADTPDFVVDNLGQLAKALGVSS